MTSSDLEVLLFALGLPLLLAILAIGAFFFHTGQAARRSSRSKQIVRSFVKAAFGLDGVIRLSPLPSGREYKLLRRVLKSTSLGMEEVWFTVAGSDGKDFYVGLDERATCVQIEGFGEVGPNSHFVRVARFEPGEERVLVQPYVYDFGAEEVLLRPGEE